MIEWAHEHEVGLKLACLFASAVFLWIAFLNVSGDSDGRV